MSWSRFLIVRLVKRRQHTLGSNERQHSISPFQGLRAFLLWLPGATRFALAPGYHISRRWRSAQLGIEDYGSGTREFPDRSHGSGTRELPDRNHGSRLLANYKPLSL